MAREHDHLSRRRLLQALSGLAVAPLAFPALANAPERSRFPQPRPAVPGRAAAATLPRAASLDALLTRANLGGVSAFVALDAQTGAVIEEMNPDTPLPPASMAKAPSALYALHHLGLEHRFLTRVLARGGTISGGVLRGDLVVLGGGDPTLQTADLARLADALIAQGLRRVEGRFVVDEGALPAIAHIDSEQPVQAGYNPAISGLNLNYNRVHFAWATGGGRLRLSMDARSSAEVPQVSVIGIEARDRATPIYTHALDGARELWTVARPALGADGSRWLPVRRPGLYAGDVLRALLAARGCTLPAPQAGAGGSGGSVLAEHRSPQLTTMAREMLRFSTNITAECLGLAASRRRGGTIETLAQSGQAMGAWLGQRYGAPGLRFVDHSGLGDGSRVTARGMAAFFLSAHREALLSDLLRRHPMRDTQGREMSNHPIAVAAKTGTLNFVNALGGFARPAGGRPIVFAILCADLARRAAIPVAQRDRPPGAPQWAGRARGLQQGLIERWAALHG
ncbi:MAG: D-alanyl-D-alanine carboxypeptidase/D-alanyl-D-alanine-endopeptidase [Pararhodobacter sp.]